MEEIEALLTTATLLAKRKGYSIFYVCANHETNEVLTGALGKDRDSIVQALVAAGIQEPDISTLIRSAFCNSIAKIAEGILEQETFESQP